MAHYGLPICILDMSEVMLPKRFVNFGHPRNFGGWNWTKRFIMYSSMHCNLAQSESGFEMALFFFFGIEESINIDVFISNLCKIIKTVFFLITKLR